MKKSMILFGLLSIGFTHAQQGRTHTQHTGATKRVGINTEKPVATMEISKVSGVPATQVQGFLLPHLSQSERNAMQKEALVNGLMIFNTSKNCIDWWNGTNWQCTDSSQKDEHGDEYAKYRATFPYTATKTFTRNNCTIGQEAGTISYTNSTPIIGRGTSNVSQADAERLAQENAIAEFNRLGQEEANRSGACETIYREVVRYTNTATFTRNNCTGNQEAGTVSYTNPTPIVREGVSNISREDAIRKANELALAEYNRLGQAYANQNGTCRNVYNGRFSYTGTKEFTKNNCATGQIGSKVTYTNPTPIVGTATSYVSQEDANRLAEQNALAEFDRVGQEEANTSGICKTDVLATCRSLFEGVTGHYVIYEQNQRLETVDILYKRANSKPEFDLIQDLLDRKSNSYNYLMMKLKPADDKYVSFETVTGNKGTLWYKTGFETSLGNLADTEDELFRLWNKQSVERVTLQIYRNENICGIKK